MQRLIQIGKTSFLLSSEDEGFFKFADRRYRNFYIEGSQDDADESISLEISQTPVVPDDQDEITSIKLSDDGSRMEIIHGRGIATWDRNKGTCSVRQLASDYLPGNNYPDYVVDTVFRIILSIRLFNEKGSLLHSAGLVRDGKGYLFAGKSGAGKSTVSRLSAPMAKVLSDDVVLAQVNDDGPRVYATPFYGEFSAERIKADAPLHGIYFLRQADENRLTPLKQGEAVKRLLQSVLYFGNDKESTEKALKVAAELVSSTKCAILDFLPDTSFWRLIHD